MVVLIPDWWLVPTTIDQFSDNTDQTNGHYSNLFVHFDISGLQVSPPSFMKRHQGRQKSAWEDSDVTTDEEWRPSSPTKKKCSSSGRKLPFLNESLCCNDRDQFNLLFSILNCTCMGSFDKSGKNLRCAFVRKKPSGKRMLGNEQQE